MSKKKTTVVILLILCVSFLLIGGSLMHKKMIKSEVFTSQGIDTISFEGNIADITITQSKSNKFKITQYSKKKIEKSLEFQTKLSNSVLNIKDNSAQIDWLLGLKGSAGISFELQIPIDKTVELKIDLNKGNLKLIDGTFSNVNVVINKGGNIDLTNIAFENDSDIYTHSGNIDIKFSSDSSHFIVNAIAISGNKNIDKKYFQGNYQLNIQSDKGNITVK